MDIINILATSTDFCNTNAIKRLFSLLGNLFNIIKIVIPIIIIVMGTIDLVKAMMANDPSQSKKAQGTFIKRLITAVCIFFVLPLVSFLMSLIGENVNSPCMTCFSNPNDKNVCNFTVKSQTNNSNTQSNNQEESSNINIDELNDATNISDVAEG